MDSLPRLAMIQVESGIGPELPITAYIELALGCYPHAE